MKKTLKIVIVCMVSTTLVSCNYDYVNINPNAITEDKVEIKYLLPTLQYDLASAYGGNVAFRVGNTMNQVIYKFGPTQLNSYTYTPADGTGASVWNGIYSSLNSAYIIIKKVNASNLGTYHRGIAKILMANGLGTLTSIYGDIPYKESFNFGEHPNPAFDAQLDVYKSIQKLLDEGISDLSNPLLGLSPAKEDLIYGGNASKWIKAAHALKARYYLHLIKRDASVYSLAESELNLAISSNDENCLLKFQEGNVSQQHPLYNERTATRNTEVDISFANLLINKADPRKDFYATIPPTIDMDVANYGPLYGMQDSYCPIITYEECLFMKAEIEMNKGDKSATATALNSAIYNSLKRVCLKTLGENNNTESNQAIAIPNTELVAYANTQSNLAGLSDNDIWKKIFLEKYIALFLQTEVWTDYRRSSKYVSGVDGLPILSPRTGTIIPKRYNYPNSEVSVRKVNIPTQFTIYEKIWWDQ